MKRVSIILPVYEQPEKLLHFTLALTLQRHKDWQLIIVARDQFNYKKYLIEKGISDDRIKICFAEHTDGLGNAIEEGLLASDGDLVTITNVDTKFYVKRLESLVEASECHDLLLDNFIVVDKEGGVRETLGEGIPLMPIDSEFSVTELFRQGNLPQCLFKRSLLNDIKIYKEGNSTILCLLSMLFDRVDNKAFVINELLHEQYVESDNILLKGIASQITAEDAHTLYICLSEKSDEIFTNEKVKKEIFILLRKLM